LPHPRWSHHHLEQPETLYCVKRALRSDPASSDPASYATEKKEKEEKER